MSLQNVSEPGDEIDLASMLPDSALAALGEKAHVAFLLAFYYAFSNKLASQ